MSKLARKFTISISVLICLVTAASLVINAKFIEPFYIYQKKAELNAICNELMLPTVSLDSYISSAESEKGVVIAKVANTDDNVLLNESLRTAFLSKGIGLHEYWLWTEDYKSTVKNGSQMRIYSQGNLDYSLMIKYLLKGEDFIAVAMVIPNIAKTVAIVNRLTVFIFGSAVVLIVLLIYYLVKRVTDPINELGSLAVDISAGNFRRAEIKTGDELEELAERLNDMSAALEQSQQDLQRKNTQMQTLLGHVSHDLKTPIALIKAYGHGMRDGMDDGTFLDTIINQNAVMEQMTERLLELSRRQQQRGETAELDLSERLEAMLTSKEILFEQAKTVPVLRMDDHATVQANPEAIDSIFDNLITNGVKYGTGREITLSLTHEEGGVTFAVENEVNTEIDTRRIWDAFYVGEPSRNKELSGSGLGLSIVRATAELYGYDTDCTADNGRFRVWIRF